ncbi:hypothetical protein Lesp02_03110 [Lentzea sp. NBRC 105346]|nr:hypothetical protein Lesp02_03110 [Lentzea sp. NBRC 105346]
MLARSTDPDSDGHSWVFDADAEPAALSQPKPASTFVLLTVLKECRLYLARPSPSASYEDGIGHWLT